MLLEPSQISLKEAAALFAEEYDEEDEEDEDRSDDNGNKVEILLSSTSTSPQSTVTQLTVTQLTGRPILRPSFKNKIISPNYNVG